METKKSKPSLSIFMPAFNEASGLRAAYETTLRSIQKAEITEYEIIIVTNLAKDGSHDGTPLIADELATNSNVKHFFAKTYVDLGFKFRKALEMAEKDYIIMIPGDNDTEERSLTFILSHLGDSEMILVYTANTEARPWRLRFVSRCYVILCNGMFGMRLKYFNGINIFPVMLLKNMNINFNSPAYMAAVVITLIKSGVKFIQIPQVLRPTPYAGKTFNVSSVVGALRDLYFLFYRIHFKKERISLSGFRE